MVVKPKPAQSAAKKTYLQSLSVKELDAKLAKDMPPAIFIFYNPDSGSPDEFIELIKNKIGIVGDFIFNYIGAEINLTDFMNAYLNVPLFGGKRLFVLKDINDCKNKRNKSEIDAFHNLFAEPQLDTFVVFTNRILSDKNITEFIRKICDKSLTFKTKEANIFEWIKEYAATAGKTIDSAAARKLVDLCNAKKKAVKSELDKLFLFVLDEKNITPEIVITVVQNYNEDNIFSFIDALMARKYETALKQFRELLVLKTEYIVILYNIIERFNKLIYFKEIARKMKYLGDEQINQIGAILLKDYGYKLNYYELRYFGTLVNKYDEQSLNYVFSMILELEQYSKSRDGFFNEAAFEVFLRKLCS